MFKVTNISKSVLIYQDKGKNYSINPGESIIVVNPPAESYLFHIEDLSKIESQINIEQEEKKEEEKKNKRRLIKNGS